jgi:hypothetical protein
MDTEMAFIRILSTSGVKLSGFDAQDRRERIRVAILTQNMSSESFPFGPAYLPETYAQAFERCYGSRLELRTRPRDSHRRPNVDEVLQDLDDEEEEEA